MLGKAKTGTALSARSGALARLEAHFTAAGAAPIVLPHLYLGETLLDLYGEDLRARAFLFPDAERGNELCLRPDFTVPVAQAHGAGGWHRQAAYAYHGPVFRRQPQGFGRPAEYLQAGIERFGDPDPVIADVEVFTVLHGGLAVLDAPRPHVTIGDLSIVFALLDALEMPSTRRAGLRRHVWRPGRFSDLISRATAPQIVPRLAGDAIADAGGPLGARSAEAVRLRLQNRVATASAPRMPERDAALISALLGIEGPAPQAARDLRALGAPAGLNAALDRFEARLDGLSAAGIDPATLTYDANFGRNLEYYDGFVFEMRAPGGGDHPPLAGGGRYDTLTARLGAPAPVPAIGGIIRPDAIPGVRS